MTLIEWLQQKFQAVGITLGKPVLILPACRPRPPVYQAAWSETLGEWVTLTGCPPGSLRLPPLPTQDGTFSLYERPGGR